MSEEKPTVIGIDYAEGEEAALAAAGRCLKFEDVETFRMSPKAIPGQEIHRPSRERGRTPTFIPFDDSYISGESTNHNSEYGAMYATRPAEDALMRGETKPSTHDEKARAFFTQQHTPGQLEGLKQLADSLVIAARPEPIEIKANISIPSPELELDADGNPTTLESAMALDAVDALCAAEDERWKKEIEAGVNLNPLEKQFRGGWDKIHAAEDEQFKKEIEEMEFDFSKESIVEMLNEELVAEGRDPFYSVQMLSAQASAALRKKQKARKKKRK